MRLALVANSFPSLSETFIYNHAAGLYGAGLDITVVATRATTDAAMFDDFDGRRYEGPIRESILTRGATRTLRRLAARLASASARDVALLRKAQARFGVTRRALRAWLLALPVDGFDIIHFEYSGLAVGWLDALPLLAPAKIIVSCRGAAEQITPLVEPARARLLGAVFELADRVHCVSEDMRATCGTYGLDPAKAFVNRPAIDVSRFRRSTRYIARATGPYRLVSTGRLHWKKGIEFALMAVRTLVDKGHDVHYEIIGGGNDEARLRFAVHDLRLDSHVTFSGRRSSTEVRQALEHADVYLLPSLSEGLSNAALEAMAMEIPVVTTTAGGMAEAITDNVNGMLVPPRDADAIAARVAMLLRDGALRESLGRAARRRVEDAFSLERQIRVFVTEYEALMRESE